MPSSRGKHRKQSSSNRVAYVATSAIAAGMATGFAPMATAVPVSVPGTGITVEVPDKSASQLSDAAKSAAPQYSDEINNLISAVQPSNTPPVGSPVVSVGQQIADHALSKQGSPYVWGATGPDAFDCSGLTSWAYGQVGKSIPRTSSAQSASGTPVPLGALQPGDIVSYAGASHVAIYIGNGNVVHALNEGQPVQVTGLHYMQVNNAVRF